MAYSFGGKGKECYRYSSSMLDGRLGLLWSRKGLLLAVTVTLLGFLLNSASALTQSHQGSAPTNDFTLTAASPNARIHISSSSAIYIVHVDPPPPTKGTSEQQEWKVSLELLALQLCEPSNGYSGDRLKVVYSDPASIRSTTWKLNVSHSLLEPYGVNNNGNGNETERERELKNIMANQIVLIPEGRWILSGGDLVATLYQDPYLNGTCPEDTFRCSCLNNIYEDSLEETYSHVPITRCIPKALVCNGNPNCGFGCRDDESENICPENSSSSSSHTDGFTNCIPTTVKPPLEQSGIRETVPKLTATYLGVHVINMIFLSRLIQL